MNDENVDGNNKAKKEVFVDGANLHTLLNDIMRSAGFKRERKCDELSEKIIKLEQRVLALQTARMVNCPNCERLSNKLDVAGQKMMALLSERRDKLQELNDTKWEDFISELLLWVHWNSWVFYIR